MKSSFLSFLLCLFCASISAQDLIVTKEGDSLNCRITKVEPDYIHFTIRQNDSNLPTLLPMSGITMYKYKYYNTSEVVSEPKSKDFPHFRAAINGGWSTRLAKISEDVAGDYGNYLEKLKTGYNFGADLTYFFSRQSGIGAKYSAFRSKYTDEDWVYTFPDGSTFTDELGDDITISFIGPFYSARSMTKNQKNCFLANIGFGYVGYKDIATVFTEQLTLTGNTFGFCFDLGYDIGISKTLAVGIQLSVVTGNMTEYEITDGTNTQTIELDEDNYENLSRLDLSVGLRFIK